MQKCISKTLQFTNTKNLHLRKLLLLLSYGILLWTPFASAVEPRFLLSGLIGSAELARLDFLVPVYNEYCNCLIYTDWQGEVDTKTSWFSGVGTGFRSRLGDRIYGGYVFVDRNYSTRHNAYNILSPGFETLGCNLDARINGYFPVNQKRHIEQGIPPVIDTCGLNFNCEDTFFAGHQQFLPLYKSIEEIGTGFDGEIGYHFGHQHRVSLYGGGYYFNYSDLPHLLGVEARIEIPILRPSIQLVAEASYDNQQRGAIVAGIRLQGGHLPRTPLCLEDRFFAPIVRNLATVSSGLGAPIKHKRYFDRNLLVRDNIYFFASDGLANFTGAATGTFENPLAAYEFTQTTIDGIAANTPNANLFFSPGTYTINPLSTAAPNAIITINDGQSFFGRTADFKCSAMGDERPQLLGSLQLTEGNNTLDSIQLTNSQTLASTAPNSITSVTALAATNAANVSICNSVITAALNVQGDSDGSTFATAITMNNSSLDINTSNLSALATIQGNAGINSAVAIGNNNIATQSNIVNINDSQLLANANVNGTAAYNIAVGIGTISSNLNFADFLENYFVINNTVITSQSTIATEAATQSENALSAAIGSIAVNGNIGRDYIVNFINNTFAITNSQLNSFASTNNSVAQATGIGSLANLYSLAEFASNNFTITNSEINSTASSTTESFGTSVLSTGIGSDAALDEDTASFSDNNFVIQGSHINSASSSVSPETTPLINILAAGIGLNAAPREDGLDSFAFFDGNNFLIEESSISALASTVSPSAYNFATVIGCNSVLTGVAEFGSTETNKFDIKDSSLSGTAIKLGDNGTAAGSQGVNIAVGVGGADFDLSPFTNTQVNISGSSLNVLAEVRGDNLQSLNIAYGLIAYADSGIRFLTSQGLVTAVVDGTYNGLLNQATAFVEDEGTVTISGGAIVEQTINGNTKKRNLTK